MSFRRGLRTVTVEASVKVVYVLGTLLYLGAYTEVYGSFHGSTSDAVEGPATSFLESVQHLSPRKVPCIFVLAFVRFHRTHMLPWNVPLLLRPPLASTKLHGNNGSRWKWWKRAWEYVEAVNAPFTSMKASVASLGRPTSENACNTSTGASMEFTGTFKKVHY